MCLIINSLNVSLVQATIISDQIRAKAAEQQLKVYSFIEDIASYGGYLIACAADEIYANHASIISNIATASEYLGLPDNDTLKIVEDLPEELVSRFSQYAVDKIRLARGAKLKLGDCLLNRAIFGQDALDIGLIDGLDSFQNFARQNLAPQMRLRIFDTSEVNNGI